MPLREVFELATDRTAIVYHHNSRRKGGHVEEIRHWLRQLPDGSAAIYWRAWSNRTYFVINPCDDVFDRLTAFTELWEPHACLIGLDAGLPT